MQIESLDHLVPTADQIGSTGTGACGATTSVRIAEPNRNLIQIAVYDTAEPAGALHA